MATHSSILAWKIPWTEEPGGLQSKGWQRVWHDWATKHVRTLTLWRAISFTWSLPTYMLISSKNALRERFVIIFDQISLHCAQPSWHKLTHILCVTIGTWYLLSEWQNEWMNELKEGESLPRFTQLVKKKAQVFRTQCRQLFFPPYHRASRNADQRQPCVVPRTACQSI